MKKTLSNKPIVLFRLSTFSEIKKFVFLVLRKLFKLFYSNNSFRSPGNISVLKSFTYKLDKYTIIWVNKSSKIAAVGELIMEVIIYMFYMPYITRIQNLTELKTFLFLLFCFLALLFLWRLLALFKNKKSLNQICKHFK